jgi:hypothetical protein
MVDLFKEKLDELMGKNRNATAKTVIKTEHFSNNDVGDMSPPGLQVCASVCVST